jgi:hypothetical protein
MIHYQLHMLYIVLNVVASYSKSSKPGRSEKNHEHLCQDSMFLCLDSNPGIPKFYGVSEASHTIYMQRESSCY